MGRGRKPLPANVHVLRGNPSKLPAAQLRDGVQPEVASPEPPEHLSAEGRAEWDRISAELEGLGLLTRIDRAALAVYCQAWGRWVDAERQLVAEGSEGLTVVTPSGFQRPSVWLVISERAVEQMHKFLIEFGMTPSSRTRLGRSPKLSLFPEDSASSYFT